MYIWLYFILFISMILELSLSAVRVTLPMLFMGGFYVTLVYDWRRSFLPFLLFSVIMELAMGRSIPLRTFGIILCMLLAAVWRRQGNLHEMGVQMIPGALAGVFAAMSDLAYLLVESLRAGGQFYFVSPLPLLLQILGGMFLFPVYCTFFDQIAYRLNYRRYRYVRRFKEENEDWQ